MVDLDQANSRMKDFYDIYFQSERCPFEGPRLQKAIKQTFRRRQTGLPAKLPVALTPAFYEDATKVRQWEAFFSKVPGGEVPKEFHKVVERLKALLWPVTEEAGNGAIFKQS